MGARVKGGEENVGKRPRAMDQGWVHGDDEHRDGDAGVERSARALLLIGWR